MGFTVTDMEGVDPGNRFVRGSTAEADCLNCPYSRLGRNEVIQQRPMIGTAGRLVYDALAKIGVSRDEIWVTNAILCTPTMAPPEVAEDLKRAAREACGGRLRRELADRPGLPVLALGSHAAQGLTGDARLSITQMAGACYDRDVDGTGSRVVIPTVHPASILRGGSGGGSGSGSGGGGHTVDLAFWNLLYDASKVNLLAKGVDIRFTDDIQIEITDPARAAQLVADFVADARRLGKFACDTETYVDDPKAQTALAPVNAKLSAIGLATPERGISIAWEICYPHVLAPLDALFADATITKVFHNAIYDVPVLERHGFTIEGPIQDTLLMHHNAFPGLAHSLQRVTTQFYAAPPWKAEYRHGKGDPAELLVYNARDTLATARIEGPIYAIIKRSQAERTYEVDLAMAHAARVMHVQGVPIHRATNEHLRAGFKANIDRARDALLASAQKPELRERFQDQLAFEQARKPRKHDPEDFDERLAKRLAEIQAKPFRFLLDSGDHVAAFLKASNVPLALQTASGRISTRKDVLEEYAVYPEVRALLTYRENAKLLSTYIERMFTRTYADGRVAHGFADAHDRVHPRWSVHKISGRWGSEAPVCFDGETEILTPAGWVRFAQLAPGSQVAQFCAQTNAITFVTPTQQFVKPHAGEMVHITGRYTDLCVTPDHRLIIERRSGRREDVLAKDYAPSSDAQLLHVHFFDGSTQTPHIFSSTTTATVVTRLPWDAPVYCVTVPTGYVVVRRTGRAVIAGNCQNVPKADKKKGRPNLRSQVIAPDGRAFVAFDAKQLEARLIALMSGDPFLLDIFRRDKDIHSELARAIWPDFDTLPVDERKVRRDLVKRPEYGAFYGGSIETLWKAVVRDYPSVTLAMIQRMVTLMQTKMRGVGIWHQNMLRVADRDGEIRSMFLGRRRAFPIKQFDLSEVVNFPIQSSGADLINMGLRDIMPRLPATAFPILQIHDAVVFECDEADQDHVKTLVVEAFTREETYNGNTLLFPVDARAGKSWADVN